MTECEQAIVETYEKCIKVVKACAMYYGRGSSQFPGCEAAITSLNGELVRYKKSIGDSSLTTESAIQQALNQ